MRFAHCRFLNKEPVCKSNSTPKNGNRFDRVVTIAWNLDRETNILSYGAAVYRKKDAQDH